MRYTDFEQLGNGDLRIRITDAGREELADMEADGKLSHEDMFVHLLEYQICNGWELVPPEDVGALTASLIISEEVERDKDGDMTCCGKVYWFPEYQIVSEIMRIKEDGYVVYTAGKNS